MNKAIYMQLLVLTLTLSNNASFGQAHKLSSVKLELQDFNTETVYDVSCDAFDYTFRETKKTKVVYDKKQLSKLEFLMNGLKKVKDKPIDVRGKITYYHSKTYKKYCFDTFGRFYQDGKLYYSSKLLIAISDILYSSHPEYLDTLKYHE